MNTGASVSLAASAASAAVNAAAAVAPAGGSSRPGNASSSGSAKTSGKRKRIPACLSCRKSKVKCEGGIPCLRCVRLSRKDTCVRCTPRPKASKRSKGSSSSEALRAATSPALRADTQTSLVTATSASPAVGSMQQPLFPQHAPGEDLERRATDRFAALTTHFRSWRDAVFQDTELFPTESRSPDPEVVASDRPGAVLLRRLLYFTSHILAMAGKHIEQHRGQHAHTLASVWLCSSLAMEVKAFLSSLDESALGTSLQTGKIVASQRTREALRVQRATFGNLPQGVVMHSLYPRPYQHVPPGDSDSECVGTVPAPWFNDAASAILELPGSQVSQYFSEQGLFDLLLDARSLIADVNCFWAAVRRGQESYSHTLTLRLASGPKQVLVTRGIGYHSTGMPMHSVLLLQQPPILLPLVPPPALPQDTRDERVRSSLLARAGATRHVPQQLQTSDADNLRMLQQQQHLLQVQRRQQELQRLVPYLSPMDPFAFHALQAAPHAAPGSAPPGAGQPRADRDEPVASSSAAAAAEQTGTASSSTPSTHNSGADPMSSWKLL